MIRHEADVFRRMDTVSIAAILACVPITFSPGNSHAQGLQPPPAFVTVDENGVDLNSMMLSIDFPNLSIGTADSGMSRSAGGGNPYMSDNFIGIIEDVTVPTTAGDGNGLDYLGIRVSLAGHTELNLGGVYSGGTWLYDQGEGADGRLQCTIGQDSLGYRTGTCTYITHNGSVAEFKYKRTIFPNSHPWMLASGGDWLVSGEAILTKLTRPDGEVLSYEYARTSVPTFYSQSGYLHQLISVSSSLGWMIRYRGQQNATNDTPAIADIRLINTSVDYCDPQSTACTLSQPWRYIQFNTTQNGFPLPTYNGISFTGYKNYNSSVITKVAYPSGRTKELTYWSESQLQYCHYSGDQSSYCADIPFRHSRVKTVKIGTSVWNYDHFGTGGETWTTITNPLQGVKTASRTWDERGIDPSRFSGLTDELGRLGGISVDSSGRVTGVSYPEGHGTTWTYSAVNRGNIIEVRTRAKSGSGLADAVITADYDAICTNPKTCNQPNWIKDAKGLQTDYTYSPDHGGVLTETGPAVTDPVNGQQVRPQKRYAYTLLYPKVKNSSGSLVNSTPVWRLTKISTCRTATAANPAACVGTENETITEYTYNSNNLFRTSETIRAGNASTAQVYSATNPWATTAYSYDVYGNLTAIDGPRTDVDDTSYTSYDMLRRKVFEIGADPDGTGTLKREVVKHSYDVDGREYLIETGSGNTVVFTNGIPTDVSDFVVESYVQNTFDPTTGLLTKTVTAHP